MSRSLELVIRIVCLCWGAVMFLVGAADTLAPRARWLGSCPEPGSMVAAAPAVVTVSFNRELHPDSTIEVVSTMSLLPSGEASYTGGQDVVAEAGLDPNDPWHRSLRAVLRPQLPGGLYRVTWRTVATRARTERFGTLYFGAGMPVPAHILREMGGTLQERDPGQNPETSRNAAMAGGILLIALGVLLPWMTRRERTP